MVEEYGGRGPKKSGPMSSGKRKTFFGLGEGGGGGGGGGRRAT